MIIYRLGVDDLADMRFACSPILETATSLWALTTPSAHVLHLPWIRQTLALLNDHPDRDLLMALVTPELHWLPDFLTPRPTSPLPDVHEELAQIRSTPPRRAVADVLRAYDGRPLPPVLADLSPRQLRDRICTAIAAYWELAIEPHWPRMRALLEADMIHRAQLLARDGAAAVLTGLDPSVEWANGRLRMRISSYQLTYESDVRGRGFWLVPTLFAKHTIGPLDPDGPPTAAYPARGIGTLWETRPAPTRQALADLLGTPRADLLMALDAPTSTIELARRRDVSPSAISQHLATLHANGLVARARAGRVVLYTRTDLADRLIHNRL
ncbi:ArsR family transcriptional regulator [Kribbella sp. NPDC058245]|uniref:ArsR/SmtB family transcription factor n=1 Tax=Kribbella sp. NPDC058245 TaxID=3346399 RepID=UPI0036E5EBB3